ncbi:hypothetical protein ABKV19_005553 [Rosa sericea]
MGSETDQRAIMMSLMLHTNAKQLIKAQNYKDAMEVRNMEELMRLSLCDPSVIKTSTGSQWQEFALRKPEKVLNELMERTPSGRYLILELLEGVAAYHRGQVDKSMKVLTSVQELFTQLQVLDESLSLVMIMGLKRSLLLKHYEEMTVEKALNLTNPETNSSIQQHLESRKSKLQCQAVDASVEAFVLMAFDRSLALQGGGTMDQAICPLLSGQAPNPTDAANQSEAIPAVNANNNSQSDVAIDIANSLASMLDNQNGQVGGPSTSSNASERDSEMESQLAEELAQGDAFTDYDIEVTRQGESHK